MTFPLFLLARELRLEPTDVAHLRTICLAPLALLTLFAAAITLYVVAV